jgi:hypothetical protein
MSCTQTADVFGSFHFTDLGERALVAPRTPTNRDVPIAVDSATTDQAQTKGIRSATRLNRGKAQYHANQSEYRYNVDKSGARCLSGCQPTFGTPASPVVG